MPRYKQPPRLNRYANLTHATPPKKPRRSPHKKSKNRLVSWWQGLTRKQKVLTILTPIVIFLIVTPLVTYALLARDISDPERLMNRNNTGIVLKDTQDRAYYSIGRSERRTMVPLDKISKHTKDALIAAEDKDFYKHGGFNVFSILRAAFTRVGGGSTITQQLAKNTLLSDERSFLRKYQELAISVAIEQNYTKDEILTMYLNSVFYGENAFGIEEAARAYFNKTPADLDLAESAMLIGLLPAPNAYSPISGTPEYAKERQTTVLTRMVRNGFITEEEKTAALAQELVYGEGAKNENTVAPHFVEMVINELSEKYGYEKVMRSGYQVKTTLDLDAQTALSESVAAGMRHINTMGGTNASGVVLDPKSGEIRALVGSADYNNEEWGKVNMVTTKRQPGSSFKPIYYASALADGVITPSTILHDKPTDFGNYKPQNADLRTRGDISVRRALSMSLNIPSVEVMQKYGIDKSITAANNLGIDSVTRDQNYGLSLALGVAEAPLYDMTNAYAAFANEGRQYDSATVLQIQDKFNKRIYSAKAQVGKQAISKEGAFLVSDILSDDSARAPIFGSSLSVSGRTVAVKTGTTENNRDAWTIGYSPTYAVGIWVGNNDNTEMRSGGSDMAGPIWRNTMRRILANQPNVEFPVPSGVVERLTCANGGLANRAGEGTFNEYYVAGALPTTECYVEPVKISVCNLMTKEVETINEEDFSEATHSKNIDDCKPVEIRVCDLATGKVIAIAEDEFDDEKYSRNTTNCKAASPDSEDEETVGQTLQVCDTTTGTVVTIPQSQYDTSRYTLNTNNCKAKPRNPS